MSLLHITYQSQHVPTSPASVKFPTRSFTLVEMLVVIGIIIVLVTLALPAASTMWDQAQVINADHLVSDILKTAANRSRMIQYAAYGVFFYVDERDNQVACFIEWRGYPNKFKEERYDDVVDRFVIDTDNGQWRYDMNNFVRVSPLEILEWTDEQIVNNDYRFDKHRNTFVIVFRDGRRSVLPTWIEDKDADDDGFGDLTLLPVGDVKDSSAKDMLLDMDDELVEFDSKWGVLIYNENTYLELPENYRPQFIRNQYTRVIFLDKLGRVVRGQK